MSDSTYYDRRGIPVLPGDILKVFHFIAAHRRERMFMYKQASSIEETNANGTLLKINHLTEAGFYWQVMDGKIHANVEIVSSKYVDGKNYRDRPRFKNRKGSV